MLIPLSSIKNHKNIKIFVIFWNVVLKPDKQADEPYILIGGYLELEGVFAGKSSFGTLKYFQLGNEIINSCALISIIPRIFIKPKNWQDLDIRELGVCGEMTNYSIVGQCFK